MPELPDMIVYIDCLAKRVASRELQRIRLANPFVLRSVTPPLDAVEGRPIISLRRLGKRIVFVLTDELFIVLHLMIAGRLWWRPPLSPAMSGVRLTRAADRLREHRGQLLRDLSDRRAAPSRPGDVEVAQERLATDTRGVGGASTHLNSSPR